MITKFKLYENSDDFPYKKYVVWLHNKDTFNDFFIFKVEPPNINDIGSYVSKFIIMTPTIESSETFPVTLLELKNHVEYSSDDLQDCVDMVEVLKTSIKFNV